MSFLLLDDGVSHFLLGDGISSLLLDGSSTKPLMETPTLAAVNPSANFITVVNPQNNFEIFCPGHES